jgi:hypothetical protein
MLRTDEMMSVLGLLLAVGGLAAYFAVAARFPFWRRVPWEFMTLSGLGTLLAVVAFARAPGLGTGLAAALSLGVLGFSLWYLFVYSMFGSREERPRVGDPFPDFALPDSTGTTFRLSDARGRRVLLLFYRGDW